MLFNFEIQFNGQVTVVNSLESNGYIYSDMLNDVCVSLVGDWLGELVVFEGVHPTSGKTIKIENDHDIQTLLQWYKNERITNVKLNLFVQDSTFQSLSLPYQSSRQDSKSTEVPVVDVDEVGSDGGEKFEWSENSNDDIEEGNPLAALSSDDSDSISSLSEDNEDRVAIDLENDEYSAHDISMAKISDKMQGNYFKYTIDRDGKKTVVLEQGMIFDDVIHLRRILEEYAVEVGFKMKKQKNDTERFTAICKNKGCSWRIHASVYVDGKTMKIKSLSKHTCVKNLSGIGASSGWIARKFLDDFKATTEITTDQMAQRLQLQYGVHVPKHKLNRAKKRAKELVAGDWEESYSLVPKYAKAILASNPGSCVKIFSQGLHTSSPMFDRIFVSFVAQRDGFRNGMRPFIGLDSCFLKGPYGGQLFTAVGLDANSAIFPIAIMVCKQECEDTWGYFLECLMDHLAMEKYITFMSDRQKGLKNAVAKVCQSERHRHCGRHLYANFRKKFPGVRLKQLFWAAVRAYNEYDFKDAMKEIYSVDPIAHQWLTVDCHEEVEKWARHGFDEVSKNDHVTNNMSESFNKVLLKVRSSPILTMLEWIRNKCMKTFYKRSTKSLTWDEFPPKVMTRLDKNFQVGRLLSVSPSSDSIFEVVDYRHYKVNLKEWTCECREWQVSGIPCRHAMLAISWMRDDPKKYVHSYLSVTAYNMTYQGLIYPVPDKTMWPEDDTILWKPPFRVVKRGRPKKNRIREAGEHPKGSQSQKEPQREQRSIHVRCSLCKSMGHNKQTCELNTGPRARKQKKQTTSNISSMDNQA